jgi:integrase
MAKIKFSAPAIEGLKPQEKVVEYFDTALPGFGIRVRPTGAKIWFVVYRSPLDGKVKRYNLGKYPRPYSLKDAREEAKQKLGDISSGGDPHKVKLALAQSDIFEGLFNNYMKHHAIPNKRESSVKEDQRIFDTYLQDIKDRKAGTITRRDIIELHRSISDHAPVMANRIIALVSTVFSKGIEHELIDATPCTRIKSILAKEQHRERVLSDTELKTLWPAFDTMRANQRDVLKLILLTAQRPGEVMAMRADELDLDAGTWLIPGSKTKNKQPHLVPLTPQALAIIRPRLTESPWVFPSSYNKTAAGHTSSTKKSRNKLAEATGVKDWTAHDLRRTARTLMARFRVKPHIAEKVMNHSEGRMVRVYDQFDYLDEKRDALGKLADGIDKILAGGRGND